MTRLAPVLYAIVLAQSGCFLASTDSAEKESGSSGDTTGDLTPGDDGDGGDADDGSDVGDDDGADDGDDGADDGDGGADDGDDGDHDDCKIEDGAIGTDVSLALGSKTVTFSDWVAKDGSPGEFVGFTITLEGADSISYRVKAGTEVFPSSDLVWLSPNGTSGPEAKGIS